MALQVAAADLEPWPGAAAAWGKVGLLNMLPQSSGK